MSKSKNVLFMVGRVDWQYNDETYYRGEGEGSTPVKLFRDKAKAQAEADRLTIVELQGWMGDLTQFAYSAEDIFSDPDAAEQLFHSHGVEGCLDDIWDKAQSSRGAFFKDLFSKMSQDDIKLFLKEVEIEYFVVTEVELGD